MAPTVAVTVIARDEESRIERCLRSLAWADEIIVVVDDRTTDRTAEVARSCSARVFVRPFTTYAEQRRWAQEQAAGEWVLWVDCDEIVPDDLGREIRAVLGAPRFEVYRIPRQDYMFGRWIRHGGWYPQYHRRLYRRAVARWSHLVHERIEYDGPLGTLARPVLHFAHARVADWVDKMARYTSLEAEEMHRNGSRTSLLRIVFEPPLYAGYKFLVQQGWRDGMHGLTLALLLGCYRLVRNLKLWDLQQSARHAAEPADRPPPVGRS